MKPTEVLEVVVWGKRAGALAADPRLGCYVFAYEPAWRRTAVELAPLTMPLEDRRAVFAFPNLPESTFNRLPAMVADALPDDFGNALIDAWMAARGVAKSEVTALDRLAYMGKRGLGSLEFRPARGAHGESAAPLAMQSLVEEARLVSGSFDGDREAQAALANIMRVGTSAGGARAKAVIAWNPETDEIRSGQFEAAPGFEHWLLKFDGMGPDRELGAELGKGTSYGRIEYAYHRMALAAGIAMAPCRLLEENDRAHFMTRRFDREVVNGETIKHHLQTLCAMDQLDFRQRATHSYSQLFMAIARLKLGDAATGQAFRRMALNVMARNCDDHTKNFSFRLKQGGMWELAPAYDLIHAHNPKGVWNNQHLMSVNGKFNGMTREDLLVEADRFGVRRPLDMLADVRTALASWAEFAGEAGLSVAAKDRVAADFSPL